MGNAGVTFEDYSCASHPSEVQTLAKEGHRIALIREGTLLEEGLITLRLAGVDWTVDTPSSMETPVINASDELRLYKTLVSIDTCYRVRVQGHDARPGRGAAGRF